VADRLPLAIPPDADGPKVRLGVLWFVLLMAAAGIAAVGLALVLAVAAALAADEIVGCKDGEHGPFLRAPRRLLAGSAAAALPLAAVVSVGALTAVAVAVTVLVLVHRLWWGRAGTAVEDVALILVASLPVGLAAAAPVLLTGFNRGSAVVLLLLVSAYDAGNFLVGTGARSPWEGPLGGMVAVGVCGFAAWVVAPQPLDGHGVLTVAVVTAALAPFGPPAASVLIGDASRPARFVRRLDTLLLVGPVAAWAAAGVVATRLGAS
jgi:hypothetical protein